MTTIKQITSWLSILTFLLFTIRIIWVALIYGTSLIFALIIASLLATLSYGVLKKFDWAFRGTAFIYLMIAIVLPFGLFNPFAVGDYLVAGKQPPEIKNTLLWLIPVEIILLAVVYILDPRQKKKRQN